MEILKSLQKLLKTKPNIENLKERRDGDGLIEAFSYYSSGKQVNLRLKGEIAIILGELKDIRAIPLIEIVKNDLIDKERFWQDIKQTMPMAFNIQETQEDYKKDLATISHIRPRVEQALKALHLSQHGNASAVDRDVRANAVNTQGKIGDVRADAKKQKLLQAVALLWELRAKRKNETTAQADPSFWAFLDESHLEMELRQGLTTLNDAERAKVQAVLN